MSSMTQILEWCERTGKTYWEYVKECEDSDIWDYLAEVWKTMQNSIERGLNAEGVLPGALHLRRKAAAYNVKASGYTRSLRSRGLIFSYALAVSEEMLREENIVTGPYLWLMWSNACSTIPLTKSRDFTDTRILRALATGGLIGNIVKHRASISGAEVGCQGEVV